MLLFDFQKRIYQELKAELSVDVYDYVPEKTKIQYVVIGDDEVKPYNTKLEKGWEINTTIHVWGGERSMKDVKTHIGEIESALSKDLDDYEYYGVVSIKVQRIDFDLVKGTIILKYRTEE